MSKAKDSDYFDIELLLVHNPILGQSVRVFVYLSKSTGKIVKWRTV